MKICCILFLMFLDGFFVNAQPSIPVKNDNSQFWEFYNSRLEKVLIISKIKIDSACFFNEGLAAAKDTKTKLWGYLNENGAWAIKPMFHSADIMRDNYAVVSKRCKKGCNTNTDGLISDFVGMVINKKGKVIFKDASQESRLEARMFLQENLGKGLFTFQRAWSLGEKHGFMNLKQEILSDQDVFYYGLGGICFEPYLNAIKCGSSYYDFTGKLILNLEQYSDLSVFENGYVWGSVETTITEDSLVSLRVLIDSTGTAVLNFNSQQYYNETAVKNGFVTFLRSEDGTRVQCEVASGIIDEYTGDVLTSQQDNFDYIIGRPLNNGISPVMQNNEFLEEIVIGVKLPSGEVKLFDDFKTD